MLFSIVLDIGARYAWFLRQMPKDHGFTDASRIAKQAWGIPDLILTAVRQLIIQQTIPLITAKTPAPRGHIVLLTPGNIALGLDASLEQDIHFIPGLDTLFDKIEPRAENSPPASAKRPIIIRSSQIARIFPTGPPLIQSFKAADCSRFQQSVEEHFTVCHPVLRAPKSHAMLGQIAKGVTA